MYLLILVDSTMQNCLHQMSESTDRYIDTNVTLLTEHMAQELIV